MDSESHDTLPSKRRRTETETGSLCPVHSDVWYEDGNVVLQAQGVSFRVHRGILAKNSAVLRIILSAVPPQTSFMIEGCPVAELPDAGKDLEHVLRALYDRSCVFSSLIAP